LDVDKHIGRIDVLESDDEKYVNSVIFYEPANEDE